MVLVEESIPPDFHRERFGMEPFVAVEGSHNRLLRLCLSPHLLLGTLLGGLKRLPFFAAFGLIKAFNLCFNLKVTFI
ncbi:hypothetical protein MA16_Dca013590 [Dendrobium catenatum]|uniref:Uncharacterized protein n=1 Tax=Dendrobium catenatum TaxID=906689 RepID=A0A2I0VUS4_9ASPA|nr:hypothetical protein MA16_Dca013590 [Dendrobium catenatum]